MKIERLGPSEVSQGHIVFRGEDNVGTGATLRYMDPESLCPDLLGLDYIGEADHLRGRAVRAFFWLMRLWPKPRGRG